MSKLIGSRGVSTEVPGSSFRNQELNSQNLQHSSYVLTGKKNFEKLSGTRLAWAILRLLYVTGPPIFQKLKSTKKKNKVGGGTRLEKR